MHVVGDDLQESALKDDETLCMDKLYDAMDLYKKAAMETREIEVHHRQHVSTLLLHGLCQNK